MKLYHYTTFANFCSIWIQQKLKFSEWTNCNDIYERGKTYKLTQQSKEYNGKKYPTGVLRKFYENVFEEVTRYKQISFCMDYKDVEGYASPMMWGHYAKDYQRKGVCLELDSSKIQFPTDVKIYKKKVAYKKDLKATDLIGVDAERKDSAHIFVIKNRNDLFFKKQWHWKFENEYRLVSKECEYLDISGAITTVYVLGEDDITLQSVNRIVGDPKKIEYLNVGGLDILRMNSMNLHDRDTLMEEKRYINESGGI
jgi:hypothetical protein